MRKIHKVIASLLVAGTLLTGIGSGIAFAEYSSFEYAGEKVLEGNKEITKTVEYKVQNDNKEKEKKVYIHTGYGAEYILEEDKEVPKDTIEFEITYLTDNKNMHPKVNITEEIEEPDVISEWIYLDADYMSDEVQNMMKAKDWILEDIKNHKIGSYRLGGVEEIVIHVNPEAEFELDYE